MLVRGQMPKTPLFPYEWYDSPNIHFLTVPFVADPATGIVVRGPDLSGPAYL